jgi:hypothetical protein
MLSREPVVAGFAGLTALVGAFLSAAVVFGFLDWSAEQVAAVTGFVAALAAVVSPVVRRGVTPNVTVGELRDYEWAAGTAEGFTLGVESMKGS